MDLRNTPYGAAYDHYGGYAGITEVTQVLRMCYAGVTHMLRMVTQVLRRCYGVSFSITELRNDA